MIVCVMAIAEDDSGSDIAEYRTCNERLKVADKSSHEAVQEAVPGLLPACVARGAEVYSPHGPLVPACAYVGRGRQAV
jgi:hypothetical protein